MVIDKKRKRPDGHTKRPKASGVNPKRQKTSAAKRVTSVDSLKWKSVDVPEMFDDAEGFYGLEEVEGVDIVRDGGTVKFVSLINLSMDYCGCSHPLPRWPLPPSLMVRSLEGLKTRLKKLGTCPTRTPHPLPQKQ